MKLSRHEFLKLFPLTFGARWASAAPVAATSPAAGTFDPRAFGAVGDGFHLDTKALQAEIDAAASAGGGRIYLHNGTFLSGALHLKSNVTLYLEAGAVLLGSPRIEDFPDEPESHPSRSSELFTRRSLIFAEKAENMAIAGGGAIDGQGGSSAFNLPHMPDRYGPSLLRFSECRHVRIKDITLRDSPFWVQSYLACEDVSIDGISVSSRLDFNNDGIDIDDCSNVRIANCNVWSGDDGVCLKSSSRRGCRNVVVDNCTISSRCNAVKLGTDSLGGFENIAVTNCAIYDTNLAGIALECIWGGVLENVTVSNIVMRNVKGPIFLRLGNLGRPPREGAPTPGVGSFRNVMISNVQATGADAVGCAIAGLPERALENVTLSNIRMQFAGGGTLADAAREIPEQPAGYPEYNRFGTLPAYGLYCRHVKNLRLLDIQVAFAREDLRPALVCEDVGGLRISDFAAPNSNPVMVLRDTREAWLEANRARQGNQVYLRLEGQQTENISIAANDLRASQKPVDLGPGVRPESVLASPPLQPYRGE